MAPPTLKSPGKLTLSKAGKAGLKAGFSSALQQTAAAKKGGAGLLLGGGAGGLAMGGGSAGGGGSVIGGGGEEAHGILEGISSLHSWIKTQTMIRPHPKMGRLGKTVGLYDEELDEDVVITLTAKNPQAPKNVVRFDYTQGEYLEIKLTETMIDHLELESLCLHKDSQEAKLQMQDEGGSNRNITFKKFSRGIINRERVKAVFSNEDRVVQQRRAKAKRQQQLAAKRPSFMQFSGEEEEEEEEEEVLGGRSTPREAKQGNAEDAEGEKLEEVKEEKPTEKRRDSLGSDDGESGDKKLQNQFSFVERATQTMNNAMKSEDVQTEPPPRASFSDSVNQWIIYDAYTNYERLKELQEEMEKVKIKKEELVSTNFNIRRLIGDKRTDPNEDVNKKLLKAAKILERMVNQNTYNDIALDFKYWEDASDEFRESEGTLLPLWKFNFEKAKNMEITSLSWNPSYNDLFAAAYGSYNFYEQDTTGATGSYVCVFSLKNPSYPEYLCRAHCGVMCVDIHPKHPHMLAAGLADGTVAVYNLQLHTQDPYYISTARNGKHQDIVWQVKWAKDNLDGYLNFYSVSGDGRVTNWTIVKTALWYTDIMFITFSKSLENFSEDIIREHLRESGRCVTFNPNDDTMFLVGTDEGRIYKCTTEYSSKYLETYPAHNTPIYNITWNHFVPSVFLTCGAEWMIKIWDHGATKPLFMFDLNAQVGDVAWAPYSSTVFAAVTVDGKVHIFDLHIDKYHPICSQPVIPRKKARLNHIAFNAHHPIIIVGDSRGTIHCLKLSPNLRRQTKEVRSALANKDTKKALELEVRKLESLLAMVREPDVKAKKGEGDDHP